VAKPAIQVRCGVETVVEEMVLAATGEASAGGLIGGGEAGGGERAEADLAAAETAKVTRAAAAARLAVAWTVVARSSSRTVSVDEKYVSCSSFRGYLRKGRTLMPSAAKTRAGLSLPDMQPLRTRCSSSRIVSVDGSCLTSGSRCKSSAADRLTDPRSAWTRRRTASKSLGRRVR
jgi:hypothetical protein